ncbi:T9SS type A sorting domain-containing protein [Hymenobacter nivis]|nr:T9SS type A sorting domain-containing protein [Hymenobacter nivis]
MPTGSATSFIDGPLSRLQTSTVVNLTFPIGSGKVYRPLTLTGQQADANPITYTAQQFNQAPTKRAMPTAAGSLQRVSRVRYFTVTNGGASNFTQGVIKLNYDVDDQVDMPAKLRIAKSDNAGNWLDLGGTGSGAPGGSIISTVAFTSFSDFVLASTEAAGGPGNNPLPVGLVSFTARRELAGVRLRWATATERNNKHFEVQRSTDGQTFAELKTVPGHGSSTAAQEYAWLDAKVEANALVYYRLRQVDVDNTDTYSPVVAVQASPVAAGVFPNPAYDRLNFHAAAGNTYRLLDMLGRPALMGKAVAGFNALNLNDLGPGIYHLEIVGAQGQVRYRVIKNGAAH